MVGILDEILIVYDALLEDLDVIGMTECLNLAFVCCQIILRRVFCCWLSLDFLHYLGSCLLAERIGSISIVDDVLDGCKHTLVIAVEGTICEVLVGCRLCCCLVFQEDTGGILCVVLILYILEDVSLIRNEYRRSGVARDSNVITVTECGFHAIKFAKAVW